MALTEQQKQVIDAMDLIDKALTVLYVFGVDDNELAVKIGEAFVQVSWPDLDPAALTNEQLALAFLLRTRRFVKSTYIAQQGAEASRAADQTAREAAQAEVTYADIGDLP